MALGGTQTYRDHHPYALGDWAVLGARARETKAEMLLTTEKDLANLDAGVPPSNRTGAPPLHALRVDLEVDDEDRLLGLIEEATTR